VFWSSLRDAQETVHHAGCIGKISCNDATRAETNALGACGAKDIERGDRAILCSHEAVGYSICVTVVSGDHSRWIDTNCDGALESSSVSARNVDRDDRPVRMAQETVPNGTCVQVGPRDRPRGIDVDRLGISGACGIESDDVAIGSPHETVSVEACVKGLSGDGAFRIQGGRHGAVDGPRRIECGDGAIGLAQEAMSHKASVIVKTQNPPFRVNGLTVGAIDRAWGVERGQSAVRRTEEP
jgi:hypothetical protein